MACAASPAEHHRQRHHRHHKKRSDSTESHTDSRERTLPPNIWALLANNKRSSDDDLSPKYNDDIDPNHDVNEIADNSSDFEPADHDESIKKVAANCPKCKLNSVKMSENELANLRIEYVKNQILHKLRLTERPAPIPKDELPEPIQEGYAIQSDDDTDYLNRHLDDYYAKTTQKIIFLTRGKSAVLLMGSVHSNSIDVNLKCLPLLFQKPRSVNHMSRRNIHPNVSLSKYRLMLMCQRSNLLRFGSIKSLVSNAMP